MCSSRTQPATNHRCLGAPASALIAWCKKKKLSFSYFVTVSRYWHSTAMAAQSASDISPSLGTMAYTTYLGHHTSITGEIVSILTHPSHRKRCLQPTILLYFYSPSQNRCTHVRFLLRLSSTPVCRSSTTAYSSSRLSPAGARNLILSHRSERPRTTCSHPAPSLFSCPNDRRANLPCI